jgi:hypothetical protein
MSDELGILADDGERMRCAQLLNLAPGDGDFPAMSLLKTTESPLALLSWPMSFSPSVNIKTSGCGLAAGGA